MFGGFAPLPLRLNEGDPRDVWTPEQHARFCSDMRNAVLTAPLALLQYTGGTTPTVDFYLAQDGTLSEPTIVNNGTGDQTITWPAVVTDEFGDVEGFNIRHVRATVRETNPPISYSAAGWTPNVTIVSSRSVRVRTYDFATGTPQARTVFLVIC